MLFMAALLTAIVCTFATKGSAIVDSRTLKPCGSIKDCLPWQVCASCVDSVLSMSVKYCSEVTPRGLCGYRDEDIVCSCDETSTDNPNREQFLLPTHGLTAIGECRVDSDCDNLAIAFPGENFRCATCGTIDKGLVQNYCTASSYRLASVCTPWNLGICSCGQQYPEEHRIWPPDQREEFRRKKADQLRRQEERGIQLDEILRQKQEKPVPNLGMGENVNQSPVAVNEMDLVEFKDQMAADNENWSV